MLLHTVSTVRQKMELLTVPWFYPDITAGRKEGQETGINMISVCSLLPDH